MTLRITKLYYYAKRRILFTILLNVVMLSVLILNVIMMSVVMLSVVMLSVVMLSVVAPAAPLVMLLTNSKMFNFVKMAESNKIFWCSQNIL